MLPLFIALALAVILGLNVLAVRLLLAIHPRHKRAIALLATLGNVMWLFMPILNARTPVSRLLRAVFGPPWFAWTAFTLLEAAFALLAFLAWLASGRRRTFVAFAHAPSRIFLALLAIGGLVGMYQALVPLRIEHVPVAIANLPPQLEGRRIALMGDLHVGLFSRPSRLEMIFRRAEELRPDVVVIAGDLVDDDPHFVPKLLAATAPLHRPLFAVLGNHEMYGNPYEVIDRLRNTRIRLLVNEGVNADGLWIAGISDYAGRPRLAPDFDAALRDVPAGAMPLLVSHQPKAFDEARRRHLPLTLCAHTHGGQLGFRPLHWSLAGVFLPFHMGLYERDGSQLYVNTGTGFWLLPFRLGMTPEITLIELHRAR